MNNWALTVRKFVEHVIFERSVMVLIVLNAITLGLETLSNLSESTEIFLRIFDQLFLGLFTAELLLRLMAYNKNFFRDPWRIFDFIIVSISWVPSSGPLSILRALRALRALRMVSVVPELRNVVSGLLKALPGLGAVASILLLIFYVGSVIATNIFGKDFPEWFGTLGASAYSLFQIMTLESWSMGIVRPIMDKFPYAWAFFMPFIFVTTFTMLNLFIGVIVGAMQAESGKEAEKRDEQSHEERIVMLKDLKEIKRKLNYLLDKSEGFEKEINPSEKPTTVSSETSPF